MKQKRLILIGILMLLTACQTNAASPPKTLQTETGAWQLVWYDEFDLPDGSAPNPEKWGYNRGGGGWGNGELQVYTDERANSYIEGGNLVIKALQSDSYPRESSARLVTSGMGDWLYGRFEVRAKLPSGQGIWPAIWMLPTDWKYGSWPNSGEIDIMELLGHEPHQVHGTIHYGTPHTYETGTYILPDGQLFSDDFHTFAVEWEADEIRWYVDDEHYFTQTEWFTASKMGGEGAPFDQPFHLLLNVAIGGQWPGYPDETTEFPQSMLVDYVRVYQKSE